eukprot:30130-Pelagococcus_subviridis.AAC.1
MRVSDVSLDEVVLVRLDVARSTHHLDPSPARGRRRFDDVQTVRVPVALYAPVVAVRGQHERPRVDVEVVAPLRASPRLADVPRQPIFPSDLPRPGEVVHSLIPVHAFQVFVFQAPVPHRVVPLGRLIQHRPEPRGLKRRLHPVILHPVVPHEQLARALVHDVQPGGVARGFARAEDHRRLRPRRERRRHPRRSLAPVLPEPLPAVGRRAAAAQARSVQAQLRDVDREETGDDRVGLDDGRERRRGGRVDDASFSRAPGRGRALPGARAVVVVARVARVAGVVRVALAAIWIPRARLRPGRDSERTRRGRTHLLFHGRAVRGVVLESGEPVHGRRGRFPGRSCSPRDFDRQRVALLSRGDLSRDEVLDRRGRRRARRGLRRVSDRRHPPRRPPRTPRDQPRSCVADACGGDSRKGRNVREIQCLGCPKVVQYVP